MPRPWPLPRPLNKKPLRWKGVASPIWSRLPRVSSSVVRVKSPTAVGESVTSARSTVAAGATAWPSGRASVATCLPSTPFQVKWMRSPAAQALAESLRTRRSRRTTPSIGGLCGTTVPAMRVAVAAALAGNPGKTHASSATSALRRVIWRRDTLLVSNTRKNPRPLMKMIGRASRAVGLLLALLLSSCNLPGLPAPSASATSANTSRVSHLQLSEAEDAQTLDPALIDDPTSLAIGAELFQGLTRLDATFRPVPALAQSWEITDSARVYTFHLRAAKYQSGATVQAQDAVTAWKRALAPETASPLTTFFAPLGAHYPGDALAGVQAVDPKTLVVRLPQPDSSLLTRLALPPYWLDDPGLKGAVSSGTGPYHLDKWDRGRGLHLSAFSDYWGPRPQVRGVDIEIEPDNPKRLDRFTSGAVDIAHGFTGPQLLAFARDPQHLSQLHKVANTRTTYLGFNTIAGSGIGPPERMAFAQAIDKGRLTDLALFGSMLAAPATDLIPPGVAGHLDRPLTGFDPVSTRQGSPDRSACISRRIRLSDGSPATCRIRSAARRGAP